jgi:hypothetical protein
MGLGKMFEVINRGRKSVGSIIATREGGCFLKLAATADGSGGLPAGTREEVGDRLRVRAGGEGRYRVLFALRIWTRRSLSQPGRP